jgi:hypothetical protein
MFGIGNPLDAIGSALGDVTDLVGDLASGDIVGALDNAADLAQTAAPFVSMVNPAAGMALQAGGSFLDQALSNQVTSLANETRDRATSTAGGATGGTGSIFEKIAIVMGDFAKTKADQIDQLTDKLGGTKDQGEILKNGALLQARAQELGIVTKASSEAIQSIGQATKDAIGQA